MPTIELEGLQVKFPYDPYDIQKDLMSGVIRCIKTREHGLLESPTGTGKTASLLCSALAWQQNEKQLARQSLQGSANAAGLPGRAPGDPHTLAFVAMSRVPKIIYATRTHTQISQAVKELKRTSYNRIKTVVLGSRDILCIHDEVSRLTENTTKNMACHIKVLGRTCAYYNNVQKVREQVIVGDQPAMDIEELITKGKLNRFCPFFMSKEMMADAELVFMPYNYLLDPKLRSAHGVELKSSIIILDEAHNITKVCEDSSSFELKSSMIAQAVREATKALNEFNELTEELKKSSAKDLTMGEIVNLKKILLELETKLDEAPFCLDIPEGGKTIGGGEVLRCFFESGFTIDQFGRWIRILDGVSSFLATSYMEATGCDKFSSVLRVLSTRLLAGQPEVFLSSYAVKVELETRNQGPGPSNTLAQFKKPKGKSFFFWCLNPAVGLDLLIQHNPRCIMLASGTLSPIEFLENELQMHFPIKIQNPHIITDKQLYAAVVKTGPGDVKLSSAFNNRGKTEYLVSLGGVIREVCSIVPQGVLVFFPSYSAMDQAVDYWKANGLWNDIASQKSVYVEPRGKRALDDLIANYYTDAAKGSGSCLMAVCRGKVSEGLDFTDGKCRAVVITGLPYAPYKNEQVTSKIKYLDSKANQSQGVRGNAWYSIDAVRALNQAVGRIIRHRNDYGAILLCDDRCDYKDVNQNLSKWVSSRVVRPTFKDMSGQLRNFFETYGTTFTTSTLSARSLEYRKAQAQGQDGSSFQYNSQTSSYSVKLKEFPLFENTAAEEPKFSELYECDDIDELSKSSQFKRSGKGEGLGSALERLQQAKSASPAISFNSMPKSKPTLFASGSTKSSSGKSNAEISNPKKKIKLVSENREPSRFSKIAETSKHLGAMRSGETINHFKSRYEQQTSVMPQKMQTPVFKPLFSSTPSPLKNIPEPEVKTFVNVKEYGLWVKNKLDAEKYSKIQDEFKNYRKKHEVMRLLNFGKTIFTEDADYKSYINGLRLVTSEDDRTIINDVISSYEDLEEC